MKIAFINYHLKRGGVTTVLKQQIEALKDECEFLVLTGLLPEAPFPAETTHIPGIAYDREIGHPEPPEQTANAIIKAIYARWPDGCDLLHVHNPTLAKNKNFLKILKLLQKKGIKLFLQIHDFAEDGR
ncbi:MAG: glycosyltransferase family 1 protein, partial [Deltaproteobacteria bacterium]|nr:glycosyltransferase family 1 protein [Deltaproteobacteria bacterium]